MKLEIRDLRNGHWYWIHKIVIEKYAEKIGVVGLSLYNIYTYFSNNRTQKAYPEMRTITKLLGITRPTIDKYNKILEKNKLVKIKRAKGRGRNNVNEVYQNKN